MQFTHEIEAEGKLSFLDVLLIRNNNCITTDWYQKPTNSNRILNYNSFHPLRLKCNIIYNLIDRAILLSNNSFHDKNISLVKNILYANDYPTPFVNKCIQSRLRKIRCANQNKENNTTNIQSWMRTISIPFKNRFFSQCSKTLKNFNIATRPLMVNKLTNVIKLGKDAFDKWEKTGIVYKFNCKDCPKSYVGESKRALRTRIKEHRDFANKNTVVAEHIKNGHDFDWENVEIVDTESNYRKRRISEVYFINCCKNSLNLKTDILSLSSKYKPIAFSL